MQTALQQALVPAVVLLNGYCVGAGCVERFVNYQTWQFVAVDAFRAYHRAQQPLIQAFVVAPMAIGFVLQVWLAVRVPSGIEPWIVWVMVAASSAAALSTVMLQLPIHAAFSRSGYSSVLWRRLLHTDWIRRATDAVRLAATVELLRQFLSAR